MKTRQRDQWHEECNALNRAASHVVCCHISGVCTMQTKSTVKHRSPVGFHWDLRLSTVCKGEDCCNGQGWCQTCSASKMFRLKSMLIYQMDFGIFWPEKKTHLKGPDIWSSHRSLWALFSPFQKPRWWVSELRSSLGAGRAVHAPKLWFLCPSAYLDRVPWWLWRQVLFRYLSFLCFLLRIIYPHKKEHHYQPLLYGINQHENHCEPLPISTLNQYQCF